ncbi:MAG: low-specificity L-threonine aldolase [Rubrobacter sp.]|nr:low-specificity L-threonine aldolase [Rubrobacter sp.]
MIDLRSDTVTKPSEEMRRAMAEAPVGDDVYGEDPTVNRLEEYVADLIGKEAAIYGPSGTMTNQIGVHLGTRRGEEILLHEQSHIFNYEAGAPALLSGVQSRPLLGDGGLISPDTLRAAVGPENDHFAPPTLLCLENTHNAAGGAVYPLDDFAEVAAEARGLGLGVHLDGARLFNAAVAAGIEAREWCEHVDTVSVCSSKGLGAPVGSLLAGDEATIRRARRVRKAFGGGMRQAGTIAAASLFAFEKNVERLEEDHDLARLLAEGFLEAGYEVEAPETNLVLVKADDENALLEALAKEGVLAGHGRKGYVRFVTHLDVASEDIEKVVEAASRVFASV